MKYLIILCLLCGGCLKQQVDIEQDYQKRGCVKYIYEGCTHYEPYVDKDGRHWSGHTDCPKDYEKYPMCKEE